MLNRLSRLRFHLLFSWCALSLPACCETAKIPENIQAPPGQKLLHTAEASGVQIYIAVQKGEALEWKLEAPRAELKTGGAAWKHYAGPTWEAADGSKIKKAAGDVAKADAPNPAQDIPWLLIKVEPAGEKTGALSGVQYVQRINTKGGLMPTQPPQKPGAKVEIDYTATYLFYGS